MSEIEQINQILSRTLKMERFCQNFFSLLGEHASDTESQSIFRQLAEEEDKHCDMFILELELNNGEIVNEVYFHPDRVFNLSVENIVKKGPSTVLLYAIQVKQRIIEFYRASMAQISNSGIRKFLGDLVETEEKHMMLLSERLASAQTLAA